MALEEFEKDPMTERNKGYLRMRSTMDYGMGILWLLMGAFLIFRRYFNVNIEISNQFDPTAVKAFGAICILYGAFRIYRGYKKNYLRER